MQRGSIRGVEDKVKMGLESSIEGNDDVTGVATVNE